MKSLRLAVFLIISVSLFGGLTACASGDLGPQQFKQTEADAQDGDAAGADTAFDLADGWSDVAEDTGRPDTGQQDAGSQDSGQGDSGQQDAETQDADSGSQDPCANVDCADGVCDPSTGACVGCLSDGDCANGGRCHDREPVCVPACCNSVTQQDSFSSVSYSHNRFDIAVDSNGAPAIAFVDGSTDKIEFAQSVNGQWLSQEVGAVSQALSTHIRMTYAGDTPHIIVGRYEMLTHFWRDGSGWQSQSLLAAPDSVSVGYVDIVADAQGAIHIVALVDYGGQVIYAKQDAQGQRSQENLTIPAQNSPVWVNVDATSDGRPVASFHIGLDKTVVVAERSAGTWSYETVGQGVSQVHGMAVGADDHPIVAYRKETNDGLRLLRRQAQSWQDDLIVANPSHGYSPDVAVDAIGDPHVVYMAQGSTQTDNPLHYARWNGAQWEQHQIPGVDRAFYPRVALDSTRTPHVAVYDPSRDAISYLMLQ